jgi:hypothetical protein
MALEQREVSGTLFRRREKEPCFVRRFPGFFT